MAKAQTAAVTVGVQKIARIFEVTARRVQQLAEEGMPRAGHGRYNLAECMVWFIRYQNKRLATVVEGGAAATGGLRMEKERSVRADAELKELALQERRKQIIGIADVEKAFTNLALTTKAQMMGLPARLAGELTNIPSRVMVQAIIEKHVVEALTHLAKMPHDLTADIPAAGVEQ